VPVLSAITSRGATSHVSEPQCGGKTNDVGCMLFEKIQALRPSGRKKSLKYTEDLEATGSTPSQARGGSFRREVPVGLYGQDQRMCLYYPIPFL